MKLLAVGLALIAAWLAGLLLYVNYFSETDRAGGELVKVVAWASLPIGIAVVVAGAFRMFRTS